MKFFIDTANLDEIREAYDLGVLDGVTTNPSLMAKEGITGDQRDEENINYVEIINDIMIGPMEKHGTTWEDVLIEIDDWNQNVGTGDVEDEFHHINKDLFRDTLYKYWGKKI